MKEYIKQINNFIPKTEEEVSDKKLMLGAISSFGEEHILYRDCLTCHMTSSAIILDETRKYVLMAYHNIFKSWGWLGGHADGDSDLEKVAVKEAMEETGISDIKRIGSGITSIEVLFVPPHYKKGHFVSSHNHLNVTYLFEGKMDKTIKIKEDENSQVGWLEINKLNDYCTEGKYMVDIYNKIIGRAKDEE